MRAYGQQCAAACALDVIGDRWSLLIVRELLWRDCRFADLTDGLPGIATNMLTDRLRTLQDAGILERASSSPTRRTPIYRLTDRGRGLAPVLRELTLWGGPLLIQNDEQPNVRGRWVASAADALFHNIDTRDLPRLDAVLHANQESVRVRVEPSQPVQISICTGENTEHATVQAWADESTMLKLLLGAPTQAKIVGDHDALKTLIARGRGRDVRANA